MSQDTRKDKRAKVVSLNVRYKSATVDEFIENHSHDVSKGGLFVKTPTPFPPGTLLKFEIRLAGDKSVISGVGRVVWKREPTQAGAEKPAGMGVKFIKIDDSSRAIIDRLITQKADAGSAYTSEQPVEEPAAAGHPSTLRGLVAAPVAEPAATPPPAPGPSPVTVPPAPGGSMKLPVPPVPASLPPVAAPPPPAGRPLGGTLAGPRPSGAPNVPAPVPSPAALPVPVPAPAPSSKPALGAKPPPRPAGPPPPAPKPMAATAMGAAPPAAGAAAAPPPSSPALSAAKPASDPKLPASAPKQPDSKPKLPASEPKLPAAAAPPPRPLAPGRKATMMGIGIPSTPPPAATGASPAAGAAAPKTAEPMFPTMDPESGRGPAAEQTVMKQAAELLEEALKEAGGSLDEIGQNPLFAKQGELPVELAPSSSRGQSGDTQIMSSPMGASDQSSPVSAPGNVGAVGVAAARPQSSPSQPPVKSEPRRLSEDLAPAGKASASTGKKSGGGGMLVALLVVVLLAAGGVYAWQTGLLAGVIGPAGTPPSASTTPPTPPSSPPSGPLMGATDSGPEANDASAAMAMTDASATSTDAGVATATDAGVDSGKVDAGKAAAPAPAVAPPRPPRPRPPPPPPPPTGEAPASTGETPPAPTPIPTPAPAPTPKDPSNEL